MNIVTGAFGYTGKYITRRLLEIGERVKTITGHPNRPNPFDGEVSAVPFNFDKPAELAKSLEGATTLYNTYWIRFTYGRVTFDQAIRNSLALFRAAREAGVRRVVHVSITKPSEDSPLPYFRGKAILEKALKDSGLSYAIIRPTVIFGHGDILINNIAWFLRKFPVFAVPASGRYKLQPVYVEDMADIAVKAAHHGTNTIIDAAGPEIYTYKDLVTLIAKTIGSSTRIIHVPPTLALVLTKVLNLIVQDVVLTREEIDGLMTGLLVSDAPPTGKTCLSQWLKQNADAIGRQYASEVGRHYQ
ncbi:MAG: SDR family oxidoreductase [Candidatus Methylomirabilales bacterium]